MYRSHRRFKTNPEIDENCHFGSPWRTGRVPWTSSTLPPYYSYRAGSNKLYESLVTLSRPGSGPGSLWDWIFTQNDNFIKDVTGRNKNYQKYQLWAPDEFIIPPSSGALALHALIISLKLDEKIVKLQNELANFSHVEKFRSKIFKLSFNFDLKTSCALPPYYS